MLLISRKRIAQLSRDNRAIVRVCSWIVGFSVVLALLISVATPNEETEEFSEEKAKELIEKIESLVKLHEDSKERAAVIAAWKERDREKVIQLLVDPETRKEFHPGELMDIRADIRDFPGLFVETLCYEWDLLTSIYVLPALFAAAIWFLILMPFWEVTRTRLIACLVAFALGIFSASLTLVAVMLQERLQGFSENPDDTVLVQLVFWIAGVGLREETLKLLCFVPVAIWLVRRKDDTEALILAAMVGLGFAFQENIGYFSGSFDDFETIGRLTTANPLHFCLTGIAGLYFYRMLVRKFHGMEEFLFSFIAVVVIHGVYDAMISTPQLAGGSFISFLLIAVIGYQYFDRLRVKMEIAGLAQSISPLGVFVVGTAALTCLILITSSTYLSFAPALGNFFAAIGNSIPIAFAFISRFRDL